MRTRLILSILPLMIVLTLGLTESALAAPERTGEQPDSPASLLAGTAQTISISTPAPATALYGSSFTVAATASSGLAVTYSASGDCQNVGATFTMLSGTGTCTVQYDQAGDTTYDAAPQLTETVSGQPVPITVTAVYDAKTYDGTTSSDGVPQITSGSLVGGDTAGWTQTFNDKNASFSTKTITPSGAVDDGNSGNNYLVTFVPINTGIIYPRLFTAILAALDKVYDGSASAQMTVTGYFNVLPGDSCGVTGGAEGSFGDKNVGVDKSVTVGYYSFVAWAGCGPNYVYDGWTGYPFKADIAPRPITVTAVTDTKVYDGTVNSSGIPTTTSGSLAGGDTPAWNQTFDNRNTGTDKTLTPSGTVSDGNGGNNYTLTFVADHTGVIQAKPYTVTIKPGNKTYDGTTNADFTQATPLYPGGCTVWVYATAAFSDKHAGVDKSVEVSWYQIAVTGVDCYNYYQAGIVWNLTATIWPRYITVTAVADTKTFDCAPFSSGVPTITAGSLGAGDTPAWTQTFSDIYAGTGKTLVPGGQVNDGNNGNNYDITFVDAAAGVILPKPVTITVQAQGKVYDGTTLADVSVLEDSGGMLVVGVDPNSGTPAFDDSNVGTNKTVSGYTIYLQYNCTASMNDFNLTWAGDSTADITPRPVTVTADAHSKDYGAPDPPLTYTANPPLVSADAFTGSLTRDAGEDPGTYAIRQGTLSAGGNYDLTYVGANLTIAPPTSTPSFTDSPTSWNFGLIKVGTTSIAKLFTVKNSGAGPMTIGTVSVNGANYGQFHMTATTCSGAELGPSQTCTVTVTFAPAAAGAKIAYVNIPDNAAGSPHHINLGGKGGTEQVLNGGFNTYPTATSKVPSNWTATKFGSTDGKNTLYKKEGAASVKMGNTSAVIKTLVQTRPVSGTAGSSFVLSLWTRGQSIPSTSGIAQAQVVLYNGTTPVQTKVIPISNSTGFVQRKLAFSASGSYTKIVINLIYSKGNGAVWFDALSLLRSP